MNRYGVTVLFFTDADNEEDARAEVAGSLHEHPLKFTLSRIFDITDRETLDVESRIVNGS